jgi:hypothetical protein
MKWPLSFRTTWIAREDWFRQIEALQPHRSRNLELAVKAFQFYWASRLLHITTILHKTNLLIWFDSGRKIV